MLDHDHANHRPSNRGKSRLSVDLTSVTPLLPHEPRAACGGDRTPARHVLTLVQLLGFVAALTAGSMLLSALRTPAKLLRTKST